jgi:ATP-binding cassette subfamily F protein 3
VAGDERTPLATVLAARPELAELEAELHAAERRPRDPELAADLDAMARAPRQPGAAARPLDGARRRPRRGRGAQHLRDLGSPRSLERPTRELSGGQRKLVALAACLARRPTCCCSTSPRRTWTCAAATSSSGSWPASTARC